MSKTDSERSAIPTCGDVILIASNLVDNAAIRESQYLELGRTDRQSRGTAALTENDIKFHIHGNWAVWEGIFLWDIDVPRDFKECDSKKGSL